MRRDGGRRVGAREALELAGVAHPALLLVAMIVAGAAAYVAAAFAVCRATVRDLLDLLRRARKRRAA